MVRLVAAFSFLIVFSGYSQTSASKISVDTKTFDEFDVFADSLDNYTVYFTGENHNFASFNTKLEYKLLTYLYLNQGVEHFIFEQSPGVGYIIEQAIVYDNQENLDYLKGVFYDPFYYLVKKLQRFNDTLEFEDKIHIHGIDVERFPYFSIYALNQIVDTLDNSVDGGEVFEQIKGLATSEYKNAGAAAFYSEETNANFVFGQVSAWGTLKSIINSSYKFRDSLAIALGDKAVDYFSIIEGLERGQEWYASEKKGDLKSPIIRERFMKDEFERVYRAWPNSKYYGQFGRCHLHKDQNAKRCYDYYMNSVANRLTEIDSNLSNQVLVIPIYYSQGKDKWDKEIVSSLVLDEKYNEEQATFLIDLAYKNGDHSIAGFYDQLPFVIISNVDEDAFDEFNFNWEEETTEYHLGAAYGLHYFNGIRNLNSELAGVGSSGFTNKMVGYDFSYDMFTVGRTGSRLNFTYFPEVNNGDRFDLKAWRFSGGYYYAFGNKWIIGAPGLNIGYGKVFLTEQLDNTIPNLIQSNNQNIIIYNNDMFTLEPNLEFRITLPIISLNFRAGYSWDISGKRWRLDGKMEDFIKSGFSAPYIQAGISLNYKVTR